jgi:TP901 family phage tail tape measure protein
MPRMAKTATVGILRVLLTANSAEFEAAMKKAAGTATGLSKDLNSIGRQATAVGMTLTKAFTVPLLAIAGASAKAAIDFESSFAGVRKTVDATEEEFAKMEAGLRGLAKQIPINVNELNRLAEAAGALGVPKAEIVDFTRVMAMLGVTTNVTSDEAAESIAKIQTVFQAAGKETENFASTLVDLGNNGASTERDILALSNRIASAGRAIGLSQSDVLGFSAAIANVGIEAEAGGSAISRVFQDISLAVSKGGNELANFATVAGQSTAEFANLFRKDAAQAITLFIEGLGRMAKSGGDLNLILEKLGITELRQARAVRDLALSGDNLSKSLQLANQAWRENSALTEEARKRFETTEARLTLLWNRVKDLGITLGNALRPAIDSAIAGIDKLIPLIEKLVGLFAMMPDSVKTITLAFFGLLALSGPTLLFFGALARAASEIIGLFGKKGIATRLLAGELLTLNGTANVLKVSLLGLAKAAGVAAAAFIGWQIGRLIADLTGLDQKIADTITGMKNLDRARQLTAQGKTSQAEAEVQQRLTDLTNQRTEALKRLNFVHAGLLTKQIEALKHNQTRLAMQDTINKAIQQGAAANITYAEAVAFNAEKEKERTAATKAATEETKKAAPPVTALASELVKTSDAAKKATDWLTEFKESTSELAAKITAAEKAGAKMPVLLDLFGDAAKTASKRAEAWGVTVEDAVERVATAFKEAELQQAIKELMDDAAKEAARLVSEMQKSGEEAGKRLVEGLKESNTDFLATLTDMQRRWIALEGDTLDARLRLVSLEFSEKRKALDQYSTFYAEELRLLNAEEAKALEEARKKWDEELKARKTSFSNLLTELSQSLSNLSQVANGALGSVARDFAMIVTAIDTTLKSVAQLAKGLKTIGKDFLGGLAGILGGGLGLLSVGASLFQKLFGGLFGSRGRDMVEEFADSFGGFDALRKKLLVLGAEGERLWKALTQGVGRNNPEQAQAAIDAITAALGRAEAQTEEFNSSLNGLLREVQDLGGTLPESLQGYLAQLQAAGQLTQENIDLLAVLAGGGEVSWQKMEELANKYGIAVSGLGKQFQEQRLHEGWQEIIDDLDTLERGGADMTAVLKGMADEISDLVQDSIQFGTTIPENMRPWIQKMIEMGLLLDKNGDKITDIGKLTFGETLQTSLQNLIATIENLIRTLGGIPTEINIDANVNYEEHNRPRPLTDEERRREQHPAEEGDEPGRFGPLSGGGFVRPVYAALGQLVPRPQYAKAGKAIARLFPPKGTDTVPAMLTPGELVLNEGQQANIGQSLDAAMRFVEQVKAETMAGLAGQSHTASFGVIRSETILEVDKRELGRAVADVLPGELRRLGVKVRS